MKIGNIEISWYFDISKPFVAYPFGVTVEVSRSVRVGGILSPCKRRWISIDFYLFVRRFQFCVLFDREED